MIQRLSVRHGTISSLYVNGVDIINPWGIETADSSGFFSLQEGIGYRHTVRSREVSFDEKSLYSKLRVQMPEGSWDLEVSDRITDPRTILRRAELSCLEVSRFMDFVLGFRFKKNIIHHAFIHDRTICHESSNRYYQYPVDEVTLKANEYTIELKTVTSNVPPMMQPFAYVRDSAEEWVVHFRMLPREWKKEVIKLCNSWYKTRPLPMLISNALLRSNRVKEFLWYRNEVNPYRSLFLRFVNPNAYPIAELNKGEKMMWEVEMRLVALNA